MAMSWFDEVISPEDQHEVQNVKVSVSWSVHKWTVQLNEYINILLRRRSH